MNNYEFEMAYDAYVDACKDMNEEYGSIPCFTFEEWMEEEAQWLEDVLVCAHLNLIG